MRDFQNIKFKWTFRKYQKRVLDNSSKFLNDGRIHIVAAPGSGKTILGLEMIVRLNSPCIIFSPTTTIREQWGERFKEAFLDESLNVDDYVSNDLNNIKLINSITYQALHSAINKVGIINEDEVLDYSNIDLFKLINENKIKTICLDEAHHLQNEWQKALEIFIKGLDKNVKIISLTATPPYDATPVEWNRYISLCGEIDDEIFVPELVKEGTLCPHQDYIAFNYPTLKEQQSLLTHREETSIAIDKIGKLLFLNSINDKINRMFLEDDEYIYSNFRELISVLILLNNFGIDANSKLVVKLIGNKILPKLTLKYAEEALQFLVDDKVLTNEQEKQELLNILKSHSLIHRNKVQICLSDRLKKMLVSSSGKLDTISRIAKVEYENLKNDLRMLVLTDYIKKESIINIGTDVEIDNISIVSIFEKIRRNNSYIKLGCLSGTLVILPTLMKELLEQEYGVSSSRYTSKVLKNTEYSIYDFKGDNKEKVGIISKLFEDGHINILVGTASLLGEGWDSPCINSLILASYVGSFMLSNQMRGRAIRTYKKNVNKTANIWHLVTIENSSANQETIQSADYETLTRRFEGFLGPNYDDGEIESGIDRITFIKPPYDKLGIDQINEKIFKLSIDRENLANIWRGNADGETVVENKVPKELQVPPLMITNLIALSFMLFVNIGLFISLFKVLNSDSYKILKLAIVIILMIFVFIKTCIMSSFIFKHITPARSFKSLGKAILNTFKNIGLIDKGAVLKVKEEDDYIRMWLKKASIREQNMFNHAIEELFMPLENPRYIIIKKGAIRDYNFKYSFSCPSLLAVNNKIVKLLKIHLERVLGKTDIKYVHSEEGRKLLLSCKKKSYIALSARKVINRQKSSN